MKLNEIKTIDEMFRWNYWITLQKILTDCNSQVELHSPTVRHYITSGSIDKPNFMLVAAFKKSKNQMSVLLEIRGGQAKSNHNFDLLKNHCDKLRHKHNKILSPSLEWKKMDDKTISIVALDKKIIDHKFKYPFDWHIDWLEKFQGFFNEELDEITGLW